MTDKNVTQVTPLVEKEERFEDKLFSHRDPFTGFDTPLKAKEVYRAEREELAFPQTPDKDIAQDIYKLARYLSYERGVFENTSYGTELLLAASQRIKWLSGRLERLEGKEVIDNKEEVLPDNTLEDHTHNHVDNGALTTGSFDKLSYPPVSSTVNIGASGPGVETLVKPAGWVDQDYMVMAGTMPAYVKPGDSLLVSDNYQLTVKQAVDGVKEYTHFYSVTKTALERLFFELRMLGSDNYNLGHVTHALVTKHNATTEDVFIVLRAVKVGEQKSSIEEVTKCYEELKDLITRLFPRNKSEYDKKEDLECVLIKQRQQIETADILDGLFGMFKVKPEEGLDRLVTVIEQELGEITGLSVILTDAHGVRHPALLARVVKRIKEKKNAK